jgi:alpha-tubulin suppressor-like RCC1 family protein
MKKVICGMDYVIAISRQNNIYGMGNNHEQQLCSTQYKNTSEMTLMPFRIEENIDLSCSNNFVIGLVSKPISVEYGNNVSDISKYKDI